MAWDELKILKKIHPKADIYLLRLSVVAGVLLILQILSQIYTTIGLLK